MSKELCEKVRISAMAILDGENPPLPANETNAHIEHCPDCRHELEQQKQTVGLLASQSRRVFAEDIWPQVATSIEGLSKPKHPREPVLFLMLCLFLLAYKIIEVLPGLNVGVVMKLAPLAVVLMFFSLLKQNPLEINQSLRLEGDTK
jgi:anti-sigma factor RsiW